jgi:hypothetical protein
LSLEHGPGEPSESGSRIPGRMRRRFSLCALGAALVAALLAAPAAQATFHLIKVREVYPGSADDSYVELQMFAAGQTFLTNHAMTVYDSSGALVHSSKFASGLTNGQNQSTVLIGDTGVQSKFGVAPDLVDPELSIPAAGGAACWNAGGLPADCVAWGNFSGGAALQTAAGTTVGSPASPGGISSGKAIRRTIEPGCPTLLEESDDSDDSATDFSEVTPGPRDNASAIVENTCPGPPNTAIDDRPAPTTTATSAVFTYEAPTATSYECRLDAAAFGSCPAGGIEYTELAAGTHTFQVRGVNASGPDPTPASYMWQVETATATAPSLESPSPGPSQNGGIGVVATAPVSVLFTKKPPARTVDRTPTFRFRSEPAGSKFECALDGAPFRACPSPFTPHKALTLGAHKLQVRIAGGDGAVLRFRFRVVKGK